MEKKSRMTIPTSHPGIEESIDLSDFQYNVPTPTTSPSADELPGSITPIINNAHPNMFNTYLPTTSDYDPMLFNNLHHFQHHTHDDICINKCIGTSTPQTAASNRHLYHQPALHHHISALPHMQLQEIPTLPFQPAFPGNNGYQVSGQEYGNLYPDPFQHLNLSSFDLNHDTKQQQYYSYNDQTAAMNHFDASDLGTGMMEPSTAPDDCASVNGCSAFSCNTDCCSVPPCQGEACSEKGTPCDDLHCLESPLPASTFDVWNTNPDWVKPDIHDEPCNHSHATNESSNHSHEEHHIAETLQSLQQSTDMAELERRFLDYAGIPNNSTQPLPSIRNLPLSLSSTPTPDLDSTPSLIDEIQNSNSSDGLAHVCQWTMAAGNICGHVCSDPCALHDHLCNTHITSLSSKTKYLCSWRDCRRRWDQVFASRNKLKRHLATHTAYKPHTCTTCGEGFSAQQALDQHMRIHTGETPYKCDFEGCEKSFKQKSALTMHKRTHTGEKPLKCDVCGKAFCESSNLSKHKKIHNADFKYKCHVPGCQAEFIRVDQLRRHASKHSNKSKKQKARAAASSFKLSPIPSEMSQGSQLTDSIQPAENQAEIQEPWSPSRVNGHSPRPEVHGWEPQTHTQAGKQRGSLLHQDLYGYPLVSQQGTQSQAISSSISPLFSQEEIESKLLAFAAANDPQDQQYQRWTKESLI